MRARTGIGLIVLYLTMPGATSARALPVAGADHAAGYSALLNQAREALEKKDLPSGLALIDQALRADPEGEEALALLGHIYLGLELFPQASAALQRAVNLFDRIPKAIDRRIEVRADLATALARQERSDEAIAALQQILMLDPGRSTIHHDIGRIELAIGAFEKAASEFREEIRISEANPNPSAGTLGMAYEGLGIAAYRLGNDPGSLQAFEKQAGLKGSSPSNEGRYHHGLVLARLGRNEEAAALFRAVLKIDPDHRGALQNLARCDLPLGLETERRDSLARFEDLYRRETETKTRRIRVRDLRNEAHRRAEGGDANGAVAALTEAGQLAPGDVDVQIDLGRHLARAGNRKGGEEILRRVLQAQPANAEAHYQLGRILADQENLDGALAELDRATQLEPMALHYRTALAQMYLRMRRNEEGVRELRLAKSLGPTKNPEGAFNLGVGLAQAGSFAEAAEELQAAVKLGYREPIVHQVLAQIYATLGDAAKASAEQAAFESLAGTEKPHP